MHAKGSRSYILVIEDAELINMYYFVSRAVVTDQKKKLFRFEILQIPEKLKSFTGFLIATSSTMNLKLILDMKGKIFIA